jgi:diguanylate cyclase (GGDEF)-like protein/PAS domain S-box-containing protein
VAHSRDFIWVANGVLLAYLLLAPRWRWPAFLVAGFLGQMAGSLVLHHGFWSPSLLIITLNLSETLIGVLLIRGASRDLPRFTDGRYLLRFLLYPVLIAPAAVTLVLTLYYFLWNHQPPLPDFVHGAAEDALGIAVATPAMVAILRAHWSTACLRRYWLFLVLLGIVTLASFLQASVPLVFLVYPLLVMVLLRLGMGWATLSLLFVSVSSSLLTSMNQGPFAALTSASTTSPGLLQQLFVATGMIILYSVSVVLEQQKATEKKLNEIVELHRMVTENNRDAIILADFNGVRRYVSARVDTLGGWSSEEMMRQHSLDLVHPLDLEKTEKALQDLRNGGDEARFELRIRKKDDSYIWVESSLRTIRDRKTGAPSGILNIVRDISERKNAEQQLREAYSAVEALAVTDALTGLANRRRFDQYIGSEWRRSMREHQPLSMLMLDADFFKAYNDTYGHTRGDSCLKQIAEAAQDIVTRPGDMVARFGGEEFAIILPNTENDGALTVAQEICDAMARRALPHAGNPYGIMTISIGCATMVPRLGQHAVNLIEMADQALYEAKRTGRNRVCNGNELEASTCSKD